MPAFRVFFHTPSSPDQARRRARWRVAILHVHFDRLRPGPGRWWELSGMQLDVCIFFGHSVVDPEESDRQPGSGWSSSATWRLAFGPCAYRSWLRSPGCCSGSLLYAFAAGVHSGRLIQGRYDALWIGLHSLAHCRRLDGSRRFADVMAQGSFRGILGRVVFSGGGRTPSCPCRPLPRSAATVRWVGLVVPRWIMCREPVWALAFVVAYCPARRLT